MSSNADKPGLKKMTTADNPDPVLKVQLSSRRGSAVPSAMTEDDLTREEKVPLNIEIS